MKHEEIILKAKKAIRHNLCQLILVKNYDDITVKEVCEASHISRMTFYRSYNNKDDVLTEYTDERFAEFYTIVKNIPNIDTSTFLLEALKYVYKYKVQIGYLLRAHREYILLEQFNSYAKYLRAKYAGDKLAEYSEDRIHFIVGGFLNILLRWLLEEPDKTPQEMHKTLMDIVNAPLFK